MAANPALLAEIARLRAHFLNAGAVEVFADILQSADTLLDLYGESIRARAFVTHDPLNGEMMLRPDFTVPVVQAHMDHGAEPARYVYSGEVFRRQEQDTGRPSEYFQVGYEVFDRGNPAETDAEVFALIAGSLSRLSVRPMTGDIGILAAAIGGLRTTDRRKAALRRHIWRPKRFRALLDRFGGRAPVPAARAALIAEKDPMARAKPLIGLRTAEEIADRIEALRIDAAEPPISGAETALLEDLLSTRDKSPAALDHLRDLAVDLPAIDPALDRLEARLEALSARGINVETLNFEAAYGRSTMEYYDGFVFGFYPEAALNLPPVATGGRYDALTAQLGQGRAIPAVGGVIRPGLSLMLREGRA